MCEECDLAVAAVNEAASELKEDGIEIRVNVRPWLNSVVRALLRGAYHPPAVVVGDRLVSQGFVPTVEGLKVAIREVAARRNLGKQGHAFKAASGGTPQAMNRSAPSTEERDGSLS